MDWRAAFIHLIKNSSKRLTPGPIWICQFTFKVQLSDTAFVREKRASVGPMSQVDSLRAKPHQRFRRRYYRRLADPQQAEYWIPIGPRQPLGDRAMLFIFDCEWPIGWIVDP